MTKTQSKMTLSPGHQQNFKQNTAKHLKLQPSEQPQKEKHLIFWFRKGRGTCVKHVNFHVFVHHVRVTCEHFFSHIQPHSFLSLGLRLHDNPSLLEGRSTFLRIHFENY